MEPPTIRMDMPADAYSGRLRHRRPLTEQGGAPIALLDPVVHIAETVKSWKLPISVGVGVGVESVVGIDLRVPR